MQPSVTMSGSMCKSGAVRAGPSECWELARVVAKELQERQVEKILMEGELELSELGELLELHGRPVGRRSWWRFWRRK